MKNSIRFRPRRRTRTQKLNPSPTHRAQPATRTLSSRHLTAPRLICTPNGLH
jgi:hypothetical protein